jgi:hypothetical protein
VKVVLAPTRWLASMAVTPKEFIYRVRDGGDSPMDALLSGTSVAAESLGMADLIGSLARGRRRRFWPWTATRSATSPRSGEWCSC